MKRIISPPRSQLDKLRQPLTPGERVVLEFFDRHLPPQWEIYIQPHLNGLRPDFVLLNPNMGIAVFEVKDWDLDALSYEVRPREHSAPVLLGKKDGKTFSLQSNNPVEKILQYKKEIYEIYCPRLKQRAGFGLITAGIIFPFANMDPIRELFGPSTQYRSQAYQFANLHPIVGKEALDGDDITTVFPKALNGYDKRMTQDAYLDMRNWLVEPDVAAKQRQPVEIDRVQRNLVTSRTKSGYRRIKGAAGSGKSLVLATRAAELLGQGKQVLVVTFNITLIHYLMDIAVRWPQSGGKTRSDITWLNFHAWCKRVCITEGFEQDYKALFTQQHDENALRIGLPALTGRIIDMDTEDSVQRYDAVLVDEGQDFLPEWWAILRKVCKPDGEMLLVADATQDIYETAERWTNEAMKGAGFRGNWVELGISYRLPKVVQKHASNFARSFLPQESLSLPNSPQGDLGLEPCELRWLQVNEDMANEVCSEELLRLTTSGSPGTLAFADLTFLSDNRKTGYEVVKSLGSKGIKVVHTYDPNDKEQRRQKVGFYMGDARIKATTLHSFKGWESRALVIYLGNHTDAKSLALLYTGLTRVKRHPDGSCLTVVCASPALEEFGKSWPDFESKTLSIADYMTLL
ncbi:Nuclease-related domain-containing protein [Ferrimonas sediminum]|uniref:Nuclease-related domain-containing protein n=1 Tax=Ferrimonas sediminum TaxID=718193 RepID=A0A1G8UX29_9GAMM|nr:AAA family ATPase [Ferrimonas sediminum]SDJ58358.1 Nuclease-related domain-containing protein [Ferrimonas sediminum]